MVCYTVFRNFCSLRELVCCNLWLSFVYVGLFVCVNAMQSWHLLANKH